MNAPRVLRWATALLLVGILAGCGTDDPVSSLETDPAAVSPPTNLRAQGLLLQWDPSPDADVVGYEVEVDRSNRDFAQDVAFLQVDTRTNAVIAYDVSIRGTEFMNTWYRVRAVDADGNRSVGSNSVYVATGMPGTEDPTVPEEPPIARPMSD
jgi:hypothetical protein